MILGSADLEIGHGVITKTGKEHESIVAAAAAENIVTQTADQRVLCAIADEGVIA